MPTYAFKCQECGDQRELVMSISQYMKTPRPRCCGQTMERHFEVAPGLAIGHVFNDRHYENLRAPDGTDISSRAKHRAYMKANNLTTVDDFKNTWAQAERERELRMAGADKTRPQDIANAITQLGG